MARLQPTCSLTLSATLALVISGCFTAGDDTGNDEVSDDTDTAGTESDTDTSDTSDTDDTTDTDTTDETDDEVGNMPPSIDSFTVDGSTSPDQVTQAGAVAIAVEASDSDGAIAEVQILLDGEELATIPGGGPYEAEFIVGGENFDGSYQFTAVAIDDDGAEATSDAISLDVDVPLGGLIDTWTYDGGDDDTSYSIAVDPNGDNVIVGGTTDVADESQLRVDRIVGAAWSDEDHPSAFVAAGVTFLPDGSSVAVGWSTGDDQESQRYHFDASGSLTELVSGNWTSPGTPASAFEAPLAITSDSDGNFYISGVFDAEGGSGFNTSYLFKFSPEGNLLWQFHSDVADVTEHSVFIIDIDVNDEHLVAAGQAQHDVGNETIYNPWLGRWDLDGEFVDEIVADNLEGLAWSAAIAPDGDMMMAGTRFNDNADNETWMARFNANGSPEWIKEGGHPGIGSVLAVEADPWGATIGLVAEDCQSGFLSVYDCDVYVRKWSPGGTLVWEEAFDDDTFIGPTLVPLSGDLAIDRFGYIYATAPRQTGGNNSDWWAVKLHP